MSGLWLRFAKDERGITAVEYGLITSLVAIAIIVGTTNVGSKINALFGAVAGYF